MNLNLLREIKRVLEYGMATFFANAEMLCKSFLLSQRSIKRFIITIRTLSGDSLKCL